MRAYGENIVSMEEADGIMRPMREGKGFSGICKMSEVHRKSGRTEETV